MKNLIQFVTEWRLKWFASPAPAPELPEIPGRDALFQQLAVLRETHARQHAERQATISKLTEEIVGAQHRIDALQAQLTVQHRCACQEDLEISNEIEHLTAAIIEKAPISLTLAIEEFDDELSRLRTTQPTIIPNGSDRDYVRMKKTVRYQSNAGSISRRVKALLAARQRAIAMQTESMSVKEIASEMYRLRQSLPEIVDEETRGAHAAMVLG